MDDTTMQCVDQCPYGQFGVKADLAAKYCDIACPDGWFADNSTWTCVPNCPSNPSYYADLASKVCVAICRKDLGLYASNGNRTCLSLCPETTFADNFTQRCLSDCLLQPNTYEFVNGTTRVCVLKCPIGYFSDNSTRQCVTDCPAGPNYYADW